ncbi:MAG: hypothetical protein HQL66_05575 [Magnetococcales bacterium]|nr:hypothetical protein [Magnetococcales bacterium]
MIKNGQAQPNNWFWPFIDPAEEELRAFLSIRALAKELDIPEDLVRAWWHDQMATAVANPCS